MENLQAKLGDHPMAKCHPAQPLPAVPINHNLNPVASAAFKSADIALSELLAPECLDADKRNGRPQKLSPDEKARLVQHVCESWATRRMSLVDIQCWARLGHAGLSTIHRALAEAGIKAYIEEFKFILSEDNMVVRYVGLYTSKNKNILI